MNYGVRVRYRQYFLSDVFKLFNFFLARQELITVTLWLRLRFTVYDSLRSFFNAGIIVVVQLNYLSTPKSFHY